MYRYVCENCGNETVVFHSMSENPEVICETCGSKMRRAIGRVGIIFKGSGFYITDTRKSNDGSKNDGSKSEKKEENKSTSNTKG